MKLTLARPSRPFLLPLTALCLCARASTQGAATLAPGETRAANILFRAPDGWVRTTDADRIVLVPTELTAGQRCRIEVLPGGPLQEEFAAAFDRLFEAQLPRGERDRAGPVGQATSRSGLPIRHRWIMHRPQFEPDMLCTLVMAWQSSDRMEAIAYTARNYDHFDRYGKVFSDFADQRVRFANQVVLAKGEPNLSLWDVESVADLLAWLMDAPLGEADRAELRALYIAAWKKDGAEARDDVRKVMDARRTIDALEPGQRETARVEILPELMAECRKEADKDPMAAFVARVHDAAHATIAAGEPPLTRAISDASLELLAFMAREVRGGAVQPDQKQRDQWAAELSQRWTKLSATERQGMSRMPMQWSALRIAWPAAAETERQALRDQWRQQLSPMLAALPGGEGPRAADQDVAAMMNRRAMSDRLFTNTLMTMHNNTITQMAAFSNMSGSRVRVTYR